MKGPPRRIRADCSARKVDWHIGTTECLLQERSIFLRRSQQHGHAVVGYSIVRQREDPANNFDAFTAFARGREDNDLIVELRLWSVHHIGENVTLKPQQRPVLLLLKAWPGSMLRIEVNDFCPKAGPKSCKRHGIASRHRDEHVWTT
jgi:hypothetical protein